MIEFEIDKKSYRAEKLNAFQQFHVSRKIAPLIPALIPLFLQVSKTGLNSDPAGMAQLLTPFAEGLAGLSDEAAEYVISTCLSVVRRKVGDNWTPVWSASAKAPLFDDLNNLGAFMQIVVKVITENLGPFISGLLTRQQPETATSTG